MAPLRIARPILAAAVALACTLVLLQASSPKFFQVATQADFLKGEVEGLAIDNRGRLTASFSATEVFRRRGWREAVLGFMQMSQCARECAACSRVVGCRGSR